MNVTSWYTAWLGEKGVDAIELRQGLSFMTSLYLDKVFLKASKISGYTLVFFSCFRAAFLWKLMEISYSYT